MQAGYSRQGGDLGGGMNSGSSNVLSGTWKWMSCTVNEDPGRTVMGLICRVS